MKNIAIYDSIVGTHNNFICLTCYKILKKKKQVCSYHNSLTLDAKNLICPLYPKKCFMENICGNRECVERHLERKHNFTEREWIASKKFLGTKEGSIIKHDYRTGIEIEAIGKEWDADKLNIFKLNRKIGIGNDQSIGGFRNPIEVMLPPASMGKLEKLTRETCESLLKDK